MTEVAIGRNEPCPCGSGKKYKRCCGVNAAPKLTAPKMPAGLPGMPGGGMPTGAEGALGGFDPSKMDPQVMMQFAQALQRLPKGQMQRLQALVQKAMSGRDVTAEAAEFERTLPVDLQQLLKSMNIAGMMGAAGGVPAVETSAASQPEEAGAGMSEEEARRIVAEAAAAGKISEQEAATLLESQGDASIAEKGGIGKLWGKITGKKT